MKWLKQRLAEHSTQVAIGAAVTGVGSALTGSISWQSAATIVIGALVTAFIPATGVK